MDWKTIKTEYITTDTSYRKLAKKYSVSATAIGNKSRKEGWVEERERFLNDTVSKTIDSLSEKTAERMTRIYGISDRLLEKIEQAVDELDIQLMKKVNKVKEIEYKNHDRPDKPTKETILETETVEEFSTIIDRSGVKAIADALKSIKEIQMLRSELDKQEQEARIANLRRQAEMDDSGEDKPHGVVLMPTIMADPVPPEEGADG